MVDVGEHARVTRATAGRILHQSRLLDTLAKYGMPYIMGSYALDLMYDPDIDITIVTDHPQDTSRAVLNAMLNQGFFQRYEYGDFVRFRVHRRPHGYILVLAITVDAAYWEIEVWFLFEPSLPELSLMSFVRQRLTTETRDDIGDQAPAPRAWQRQA